MSELTARKFESTMQTALIASLGMQSVYRASESLERLLPCVVLKAAFKGPDYNIKIGGRFGEALEFSARALVAVSAPDSARSLEEFAARLRAAVESATISGGWNYLRLDHSGDDRAIDDTKREYAHIYTVTAHPI